MHAGTLRAAADLVICRRIKYPHTPSLPVLDGRRTIRIEHVALVQHSIRNFSGQFAIHDFTFAASSACSSACSQLESPWLALNSSSFSKTSRRRHIQAVLG